MLHLLQAVERTMFLPWINMQERIEEILTELGYELKDRGKFWQTNALYREGDNRTALQIWKDTGIWKDFVANTKYLPFKALVQLSTQDSSLAERIIKDFTNHEPLHFEQKKMPKMELDQFFDHDEVKSLLPHYSFYNKKGISNHTLEKYKCGFSMSGKMNGRFVFPIYDVNGKVIGVSGRHLLWKEASNFPKWKHIGRKANWIYPAYIQDRYGSKEFLQSIEDSKEIILVEGVGDSLALTEQGRLNHLIVFGLDLSSKQMAFLSSLNLSKIVIATNNDEKKDRNIGLGAAIKIFLKLIDIFDISKVEVKLPLKKDFGEMLESDIPLSDWDDKKIDKIEQIKYILEFIEDNKIEKMSAKIKILKNFIQQYHAERDFISE